MRDLKHRGANEPKLVIGDGKGWSERPTALLDVVIATGGRAYTLTTRPHLLEVPEVAALRGTAPASAP
jgi:hypothetical protein